MFTLKWAKRELLAEQNIEFLFRFTCREINTLGNFAVSLKQMFMSQFPAIFSQISLEELEWLSSRVLIVVDGLDELNGIYNTDCLGDSATTLPQSPTHMDCATQQCLKNVMIMLKTNGNFLKGHKSIACGRPKACEHIRAELHKSQNLTKTVEVCGFSPENIQRYITRFFRFEIDKDKANRVTRAIERSNDLIVMAAVPVFLWVICNVYSEDLVTEEVHSETELYLYTTIVFMRNHLQTLSENNHENLFDLVEDADFLKILISLATLSVQTYMDNKVLFTENDISKLNCPIHLEQTGFIVKTSGKTKVSKSVYQFRHLVLQEFLCALYLSISKDLERFIYNRELTSCISTMLGINRLLNEKKNCLFAVLFDNLIKQLKYKTWFSRLWHRISDGGSSAFYDRYIAEKISELTIPNSLIKKEVLNVRLFSYWDDISPFLNKVYESKYVNAATKLESAKIIIGVAPCPKIIFLLQALDIQHITYLEVHAKQYLDEFIIHKDWIQLISMCAGQNKITTKIIAVRPFPSVMCHHKNLTLNIKGPMHQFILAEEIKEMSSEFCINLKPVDATNHLCRDVYEVVRKFEDLILYAMDSKKQLTIIINEELKEDLRECFVSYFQSIVASESGGMRYIHFE